MTDAQEKLKRILVEEFEIDAGLIRPDAHLLDDLDIDSIDAVDILARLRELTGKSLPSEALRSVRTVGDVIALLDGD
ncbi:MAG: acyl carrier protein [Pseudomonadales bacterium]|nr:acyl carrier protein [Pseudomonadales bacterium]MCP5184439.1 acyl carrier protein [Pseudomonadales bacterium]